MMILSFLFETLLSLFTFKPVKTLTFSSKFNQVEVIEYNFNDYKIKEYLDISELYFKDKKIKVYNNPKYYKYLIFNDNFYIFSKDDNIAPIKIEEFNFKGALNNTILLDDNFINDFDVIIDNEDLLFVGSINNPKTPIFKSLLIDTTYLFETNALIFRYNPKKGIISSKIFGGLLNDYFEKIVKLNNDYYILGHKDMESGGDFGNGGDGITGYFLFKIDFNFENPAYLMFNEPIKHLEISDSIYVYTTKHLFTFDSDLNQKIGLKFASDCIFGKMMFNYITCILSPNNLKIYDINKNIILEEYDYPVANLINKVKIVDDKLYLISMDKIYQAIFYDNRLENIKLDYDKGDTDNIPKTIMALPNNLKFSDFIYENGYDNGIFGNYKVSLNYDGVLFNGEIMVNERCNVTNGYIYPLGYKLLFSGNALLNGNEIFNNYEITDEGSYELILNGKDKTNTYNFKVLPMDINYNENQIKNWDYEVFPNQDLNVDLLLNDNEDIEVKKVIVNDKECDFKYDDKKNTLTIIINEKMEGIYKYHIDKIVYLKNNQEYSEIINKDISVKVVSNKISLESTLSNTKKLITIKTNILNNNKNLRFIAMKTKGSNQKIYYIPLKKGKIVINEELQGIMDVDFYLVYDIGKKYLEEELLFSLNYDFKRLDLGSLDLTVVDNEVENITINLNNTKNINSLTFNNETITEFSSKPNLLPILFTSLFVGLFFIILKIIKVVHRNKIKNKTS